MQIPGNDTLDFSKVSADLTFTIHTDGTVSVTDGTNSLVRIANIENLVSGSGNNHFVFEDGAEFDGAINPTTILLQLLNMDNSGGGTNTLDFSAYSAGIAIDLGVKVPGTGLELYPHFARLNDGSGTAIIGSFYNMHNVIGGAGDDDIWGNEDVNVLFGGAGNDTLVGRGGKDLIEGGAGDDTLYGSWKVDLVGQGDTVSYATASSCRCDDKFQELWWTKTPEVRDRIMIVGFTSIIGSDYDDTLTGDILNDTIFGGAGNERIKRRPRTDFLEGVSETVCIDGGGTTPLEISPHTPQPMMVWRSV